MRKVIIDKAERLYKTPGPFIPGMARMLPISKHRDRELIDLARIRHEFFVDADYAGEAAAIYGNVQLRGLAENEEITYSLHKANDFYFRQFGVKLQSISSVAIMATGIPTEILLCLGIVNSGDKVALCDPSDPIFHRAASLSSGTIVPMPISERTDYLPSRDLGGDRSEGKLKLKFLNYPHNPTGAAADSSFFEAEVKAASQGDYLICHRRGFAAAKPKSHRHPSILQGRAAGRVAIEISGFNIGYGFAEGILEIAVGSPDAIAILKEMDSLLSNGIQKLQLKLIEMAMEHYAAVSNSVGDRIKDNAEILSHELQKLGWWVYPFRGSPFLWASHPHRRSSVNLAKALMRRSGVLVAPGVIFGENGEGFVRFALTATEPEIVEASMRIAKSLHPLRTGKAIINGRLREIRNG